MKFYRFDKFWHFYSKKIKKYANFMLKRFDFMSTIWYNSVSKEERGIKNEKS